RRAICPARRNSVNWIERRIKECAEQKLPKLDLSAPFFRPADSSDLFREIPSDVFSLHHLKVLVVDSQPLARIPPEIAALDQLEEVSASFCEITDVSALTTLPSLRVLKLTGNSNEVGDVRGLTNLESLSLSRTTTGLDHLTQLKTLVMFNDLPSNLSKFHA